MKTQICYTIPFVKWQRIEHLLTPINVVRFYETGLAYVYTARKSALLDRLSDKKQIV